MQNISGRSLKHQYGASVAQLGNAMDRINVNIKFIFRIGRRVSCKAGIARVQDIGVCSLKAKSNWNYNPCCKAHHLKRQAVSRFIPWTESSFRSSKASTKENSPGCEHIGGLTLPTKTRWNNKPYYKARHLQNKAALTFILSSWTPIHKGPNLDKLEPSINSKV